MKAAELAEQLREGLQQLMDERERLEGVIGEVNKSLQDLSHSLSVIDSVNGDSTPQATPRKKRPKNESTVYELVQDIMKRKPRKLWVAEDVAQSVLERGYRTTSDLVKFVDTVYVNGINKLMSEGKVEGVGERPNMKYRWA